MPVELMFSSLTQPFKKYVKIHNLACNENDLWKVLRANNITYRICQEHSNNQHFDRFAKPELKVLKELIKELMIGHLGFNTH